MEFCQLDITINVPPIIPCKYPILPNIHQVSPQLLFLESTSISVTAAAFPVSFGFDPFSWLKKLEVLLGSGRFARPNSSIALGLKRSLFARSGLQVTLPAGQRAQHFFGLAVLKSMLWKVRWCGNLWNFGGGRACLL